MYWLNRMSKLRKSLRFIASSLFCAILVYVLLIVVFPPRIFLSPYYMLLVLLITGLFLFLCDFALSRLVHKIKQCKALESIKRWPKKKKLIWYTFSMILIILLILIKPVLDNVSDKKVLEKAMEQFSPILYSSIPEAKVDRTLVELQKTLDRLRAEYIENPPVYLIKVHLFSDIDELVNITGISEWSAGGILTGLGRPPEIAIAVEKESSIWDNTLPTPTPSHEITHIVTFEALQLKDMLLVPRFYLEGMAEYESLKAINRFPDRLLNRIGLIFYNGQFTGLEVIPTLDIKDESVNEEGIFLFYRLSGEFIRYLINTYGEHTPWYVVKNVGQGLNFHDAFKREYNKEYSKMFSEFLEYFY